MDFNKKNTENDNFVTTSDKEIEELLQGSKATNTNKSTETALNRLRKFLKIRGYLELESIDTSELPTILTTFYTDVRTKKTGELYKTSSFKVLRAGLNRYFKRERSIDIVTDDAFLRCNLIFDSVQVKAKKSGKGTVNSTPHISPDDLQRIGDYLNIDHMNKPDPRILQHAVQFFIMFFFCRRGQENLYDMTSDHFKLIVQEDGNEFAIQNMDEKDKNHGVNETEIANQGKMYADPGKAKSYSFSEDLIKFQVIRNRFTFMPFDQNTTN